MSKRKNKSGRNNAGKSRKQRRNATKGARVNAGATARKGNKQAASNVPVKRDKGQAVVKAYLENTVDEIAQAVDEIKTQINGAQKIDVATVVKCFQTVLKETFEALETIDLTTQAQEEDATTKEAQDYYFAIADLSDSLQKSFDERYITPEKIKRCQIRYKHHYQKDVRFPEIWNAERSINKTLSTALKYVPCVKPFNSQTDVDVLEGVKQAVRGVI